MKFTLSWLKDWLDTEADPATIADTLTNIGLEVEDISNPAEALAPYKIVAQEPDSFVLGLLEAATAALAVDRARLLRPAMNAAEYIASLERAGLSATAAVLRAFADVL